MELPCSLQRLLQLMWGVLATRRWLQVQVQVQVLALVQVQVIPAASPPTRAARLRVQVCA
jgi:hypothetical protein